MILKILKKKKEEEKKRGYLLDQEVVISANVWMTC